MFSSTHFDIRLSLQSSQVYKKPSNWNGEQFNAERKKNIAGKSGFKKKLLAARLKSYEIHLPDNSAPHKPLPINNQKPIFWDKEQNPYAIWIHTFLQNVGGKETSSTLDVHNISPRHLGWVSSTLGTSSWRGTIDHPQCGTQVTTAFGQDLGVALVTTNGDTGWRGNLSDILGIWCIILCLGRGLWVKMMSVSEWWGSQICWCSKLCCQIWRPYVILWFPIPCSNTLTSSENLGHGISYLFSIPIAHLLVPTADDSREGVWFLMGHVGH